jgi:hypothetical protein
MLDNLRGTMEIKGNSFDEDAIHFFQPILNWLDNYKANPKPEVVLTLEFKYFNTSSAKCIYEVLDRFSEMNLKGVNTVINWFYLAEDVEMKHEIMGFSQLIEIPFNIKPIG